jgi:predicted ATPase/class 3 adenylate cyclase
MANLPTGTITFFFTDIEGSTRLWDRDPEAMKAALARHDALAVAAIAQHHGTLVKSRGEGDSLFAVFARASDAVAAACALQRAVCAERWSTPTPLRLRMALHTGEAELRQDDYYGAAVNRCVRLRAVGHGGQILLSLATKELVRATLPAGASLRDLGAHHLRDLARPERVFQLLHPELPAQFPPLRSLSNLPNNLPIPLTSFIGRERELKAIKGLLATTRLLTLTGVGGCGKTRLSLHVGADLLEEYPDGVWLVELAPVTDPTLVPQAVASAIGVREESRPLGVDTIAPAADRLLIAKLADYLQHRKMLLILDNCEHLLSACAQLADTLLQSCPNLRILASSREGLGIAGETTWHVSPLSLPDLQQPLPAGADRLLALTLSEAVRLFVERAKAALPTFAVTDRNVLAVAQICQRLDGIPLAIELSAARVKSLTVEQIADRLDDRFRLLTGGSRTALPRQQTLQALIDWSYELLSEKERALLRRLSVFADGWTLEAAEPIGSEGDIEAHEVLDLLTHLVGKSLVMMEEQEGEARYRLLETVRQYSRDKLLEVGEAESVRRRHRNFFLDLAERAEPEIQGPDQRVWLERLEQEHDNLRAALGWSLADRAAESSLRLVGALWWFWHVRGYWSEGRRWMEEALAGGRGPSTSGWRAKALNGAGVLAWRQGDYDQATKRLEESLTLSRDADDKRGMAYAVNVLGLVAHHQGDNRRATQLLEKSLTLFREIDDKRGIAYALSILGLVAHRQGDHKHAGALCEESLALRRELGDKRGIALTLRFLGVLILHYGDYALAATFFEEGLELFQELGDTWGMAESLSNLGLTARFQGEHARAAELYKESLALRRDLGDRSGIALCLEGLAAVGGAQQDYERAARLLGAAETLREALDAPIPPTERAEYDQNKAVVCAGLDQTTLAAAWAQGRALTLGEMIEHALENAK